MTLLSRRKFTAATGAALGLGLSGRAGEIASGTRLKLAHTLNSDHPVHKAMEFMGERLSELSGGTIGVDIYPNGQLGSERQLIELLQIGSLAMTIVSAISVEGYAARWECSLRRLCSGRNHHIATSQPHGKALCGFDRCASSCYLCSFP